MEALVDDKRFVVKECLGTGAMGVVYRAYDNKRNHDVAIKNLRRFDGAALYRFKTEFRSLTDLVHENLVTLYELICTDDRWYFTMELVEGVSFLEHTRPFRHLLPASSPSAGSSDSSGSSDRRGGTPGQLGTYEGTADTLAVLESRVPNAPHRRRSDERYRTALHQAVLRSDRLRPTLRQITLGVQALHAAGKLHCDLKPSNVLVAMSGRPVVCDFGLVTEVSCGDSGPSRRARAGTPAYMSPEQALGTGVGAPTDWYALGVMLYEALTGALPLSGTLQELIEAKQSQVPPRPRSLDSRIPEELDELCMKLLVTDPAGRADGEAILSALGTPSSERVAPAVAPVDPHSRFVGRAEQLAELEAALAVAAGGRAACAFVHGPSGMGKSSLVATFLRATEDRGKHVVLRGRCYQRESVPYKALDSLVDALSNHFLSLDDAAVQGLVPRDLAALVRLFPVLRRDDRLDKASEEGKCPSDPQQLRTAAFGALRYMIRQLGERHPTVLYIDDLQWGDLDSASFLIDLIRHPRAPRVLLVAGYRDEEAETSPLLRTLLASGALVGHHGDIHDISIGPLAFQDAVELALTLLGTNDPIAVTCARQIAKEASGHPFLISELTRVLTASGGETIGHGLSLNAALTQRVSSLPDEARSLLTSSAIAGRPVPLRIIARAAEVADEPTALSMLQTEHMVRTRIVNGVEVVEPYHDKIREVVVHSLADGLAQRAHRNLAQAFEAEHRIDPLALVELWINAGDTEKAGAYAKQAAVLAEESCAFDRAAHHYGLVLELCELEPAQQREIHERRGDALVHAGDLADGARAYLRAATDADPAVSTELRRRALEALLRSGQFEEGMQLADKVLEDVGLTLPRSHRRALLSVAWRRLWIAVRGLRFRRLSADKIPPEALLRIDVCWSLASGLSFLDPMFGTAFQMRQLVYALAAGDAYRATLAFGLEIGFRSLPGRKTRARVAKLGVKTMALAAEHGEATVGFCKATMGVAAFLAGDFQRSYDLSREGHRLMLADPASFRWQCAIARFYETGSMLYLGRIGELVQMVPILLGEALDRGDQYQALGLCSWRSNTAWLAMDLPAEARRQAQEATSVDRPSNKFHLHHYYQMLTHSQIDLYTGEIGVAAERVSTGWRELTRSMLLRVQSVRIEGQYLRARSALAGANARTGSEAENLRAIAEQAAKKIDKEATPWGTPLAALARAGAAVGRGDTDRARSLLDAAVSGFEQASMLLYAAAARRRLGELLGGDEGRELVNQSEQWMFSESIAAPQRMAAMLAPWPGP